MERHSHDQDIRDAFTAQAESFNAAGVANADDLLAAIIAAASPSMDQRWLEAACGPGIVARRLAPHVASVEGIDVTEAMIELARREAHAAGVDNASFLLGDVAAIPRPDAHYDGAVTRFSVHHLPVPERMFAELARVVRPGGRIVVVDHIADTDADAAIWSQQIERLRDPSHWTCQTAAGLRALGERVGFTLIGEQVGPYRLDFEDWIARGGADESGRNLIEQALENPPATVGCFAVDGAVGSRTLTLQGWTGTWVR